MKYFFQLEKLEKLINTHDFSCSDFLKMAFEQLKEANPDYSIRLWAKDMGFPTHTTLSRILADQYRLNPLYFSTISDYLKLSSVEKKILESLVWMEYAKSIEEREAIRNDLINFCKIKLKKSITFTTEDSNTVLRKPFHALMLELVGVKGFKDNVDWIKKKVRIDISTEEIKNVIGRLLDLKLLSHEGKKIIRGVGHLQTQNDQVDKFVQESHSEMLKWASQQALLQEAMEKEFQSYVLSADEKSLPLAKQLIREFVEDFAAKVEAKPGTSEHLYQFSIQFFKLTND